MLQCNCMHLIVMYGGIFFALVLCLIRMGGLRRVLRTGSYSGTLIFCSPVAIGGTKISSWVLTASLLGACTAQAGIQPVLAAKDEKTARRSCFYTALVVAPFGILTAALGIAARIMSEQGTLLDSAGKSCNRCKISASSLDDESSSDCWGIGFGFNFSCHYVYCFSDYPVGRNYADARFVRTKSSKYIVPKTFMDQSYHDCRFRNHLLGRCCCACESNNGS